MAARQSQTKKREQTILLFSFLVVPTVLLILFVLYPQFELLRLSFTSWNGIDKTVDWVGLNNYFSVLFSSPDVWTSLRNNFLYFLAHLAMIPLELWMAVIIDSKIRGSGFFRNLVFMPYIINGVAIAYMFNSLYAPDYANGAINQLLIAAGLQDSAPNWLSDPQMVNYSLVIVSLWKYSGLHIVLFLAGMQSISRDLYEAAELDGATAYHRFTAITLPGILPIIEISLFLNARGAFQVFDIPFIMTGGGPGHASSTFSVYTIETAFKFNNVGMASAMAVTLLLLILLISKTQDLIMKRTQNHG